MQRDTFSLLQLAAISISLVSVFAQSGPSKPARDFSGRVFEERLKHIVSPNGESAVDCGATKTRQPDSSVSDCGEKAFQNHSPFFLAYYDRSGAGVDFAYGLAEDSAGNVFAVTYEPPGFPPVAPNRHTQVLDDNQTRVSECIKPVTFGKTRNGLLACITPVNEEESAVAARQKPIDTTICAINDDPAAFNNKMVRIRGNYSGGFEYSLLSSNGCSHSLWFQYGGGGNTPSLVAYVGGGAKPGSEDSEGKYIFPVPVKLVRDANFERFEKLLMQGEQSKYASHCATATFIGRIDAVSREVHEFRKNQSSERRSDFLGFGHMGMFEAQFVLQSVEADGVVPCGQ